jgi:hypothetical protein
MLSLGLTGISQEGHLEEGMIIDIFLGILYIHTLRNEPITEPNIKTMIYEIMLCILTKEFLEAQLRGMIILSFVAVIPPDLEAVSQL